MVRKTVWLAAICLLCASVVALVRAQETPNTTGQDSSSPALNSSGRLAQPGSQPRSPTPATTRQTQPSQTSPLAERLKSIRQSIIGGLDGGTNNGAAPQPINPNHPSRRRRTGLPQTANRPANNSPTPVAAPPQNKTVTTKSAPLVDPSPVRAPSQPVAPPVITGTSETNAATTTGNAPSVLKKPIPKSTIGASPQTATVPKSTISDGQGSSRRTDRPAFNSTGADSRLMPSTKTIQAPIRQTTQPSEQTESLALSSTGPALKIDTTGPRAITIGKQASFVVSISNLNDAIARDVMVSVRLPDWVEVVGSRASTGAARRESETQSAQLVWSLDQLAGRGSAQLTIGVVANQNQPVDMVVDWSFKPAPSSARIIVQQPRLEMALSGPADILYGDTKSYTITISNPGTGDADNVVVKLSEVFGGGDKTIGTIKAGQQQQLQVSLSAREAGEVQLSAAAVADGGLRSEAVQRVLIRRAILSVEAKGPDFKYAGSVAKYQVRVANVGDATAKDVLAAVALPVGAKYLSGLDGSEQVERGLRWSIGELGPGAERLYDISCQLNQDGKNEFQTGARAGGGIAASNAVVTTVEALADLKLSVNDPQGPKPVGQDVVYEIHIANRGTKAASDVKVVLQFSEGVEPVAVDGGRADLVPGQAVFQPISKIEAGSKTTLKITARGERAGNHVFRVVLTCTEPETRRVAEGTTRFFGDKPAPTANRQSPTPFK